MASSLLSGQVLLIQAQFTEARTYTRNETNLLTVEVDASAPNVTAEHPGRPPVYISCVDTQEKY